MRAPAKTLKLLSSFLAGGLAGIENSAPATSERKARRSTLMRRNFSVSNIPASPFAIKLKGLGVPIGEVEPNATSTAANEETAVS